MKILYVTRKFPPSVGGMETAAKGLYDALRKEADVKLVAYGGKNKYLPTMYPWLVIRALFAAWKWHPDVVYIQDGVLAPLGWLVRGLGGRPVVVTLHGKELTYKNSLYVRTVLPALRHLDAAVVISERTKQLAEKALGGLPTYIVQWGVADTAYDSRPRTEIMKEAAAIVGISYSTQRPLVFTSGRLIRRKGVLWFVDKVMPKLVKLHPDVLYAVVGKGPDYEEIVACVANHHLENNVRLLGYITDEERNVLYNAADLFVMPNIPVAGDMEGFGLVALEASSCGTPVVTSGIEGIADAVTDGRNGRIVTVSDADAFARTIAAELTKPSLNRAAVRHYVTSTFDWQKTAEGYLEVLKSVQRN